MSALQSNANSLSFEQLQCRNLSNDISGKRNERSEVKNAKPSKRAPAADMRSLGGRASHNAQFTLTQQGKNLSTNITWNDKPAKH